MQYRKTLLINFCAALACCLIGLATAVPMPETPLAPGNHIANITVSVQIVQSVNGSADVSNTTSTSSTTSTSFIAGATPMDPTPTPTPSSTSSETPTKTSTLSSFPEATVTVVKQIGTSAVVLASQGTTTTILLASNGTDVKPTSSQ